MQHRVRLGSSRCSLVGHYLGAIVDGGWDIGSVLLSGRFQDTVQSACITYEVLVETYALSVGLRAILKKHATEVRIHPGGS